MTPELAIRMILLMTLMPGSDYPEILSALLGDLAGVPWRRPYRVPTATVCATWRGAVGPAREPVAVRAQSQGLRHANETDLKFHSGALTQVPRISADVLGSFVITSPPIDPEQFDRQLVRAS